MKPRDLYLALCAPGLLIPYIPFVRWLGQHGLDLRLFFEELFSTRIGSFFGLDVLVSALAVLAFAGLERRRVKIRRPWLPVIALLSVGVSLALPLLLYLREVELEARAPQPSS